MESPRFGDGPAWESDSRVRTVAHPNRILGLSCDPRGAADALTPAWSNLTGLPCEALAGAGWHAAIEPEDLPQLLDVFSRAGAAAAPFRQQVRLRRGTGDCMPLVIDAQPRLGNDGQLLGYLLCGFALAQAGDAELEQDLAEERLTDLIRAAHSPGLALDHAGRIVFVNAAFCAVTGRSAGEILGRDFAAATGASADACSATLPDFPPVFDTAVRLADGASRTIEWHAIVIRRSDGSAKGSLLLGEDITDELRAAEQLQLTHRVFETTRQAMLITDANGTILSVNAAFTRLTGYSAAEAIGRNPRILQSGRHDPEFYNEMWRVLTSQGHWHGDIWDRRKDGSVYPKFLSISAIRDPDGTVSHYSGIFHDISERKALEEQLDRLAHYDPLTGLANRTLLFDRLEAAISLARRSGRRIGLLFLDLDRFKRINDRLGHAAGDGLLKAVAGRLRSCLRRHDTAARIGGDEFVLLLPELASADDAASVAQKVLSALTLSVDVDGDPHTITPSIGISLFPDDGDDSDHLLRNADRAMYVAKAAGRGRMAFSRETSGAAAPTDPT